MSDGSLSRREFIRASLLAAAAGTAPLACTSDRRSKPNLLFLCSDQQHWQAMGSVDDFFHTPNSDALSRESVVFENAFCSSPQCSPSRSSMLTGFYPHRTHMMNNQGAPGAGDLELETIGPQLRRGGYHTGYFGKWHLGDDPLGNRGWDEEAKHGSDAKTTGRAIDFLHRHARDEKPFALFLMYLDPHDVYRFQPGARDVSGLGVPLSRSWQREEFRNKPAVQKQFMTEDQGRVIWGRPRPIWEEYRDFYRTKVRLYDDHLGVVISILRDQGLWEDTIVVNTSDHGDMDTRHKLVFKGPFMYEHTIRIPMTVRVPEAFGGAGHRRVTDYDWVNVDTVPTLLDLAGLASPQCHGRSAKAALTGESGDRPRDYVIGQYYGKQDWLNPIRMIRTHELKLNVYIGHRDELYDLENDPDELVNRAGDPALASRQRELRAELDGWMRENDDPFHGFRNTALRPLRG